MTGRRRFALGAVTVLLALLLQTTVVARLPLPGSPPDLLLVLVVAYALAEGSASGMLTGFAAGLLADLLSDAELGRLALVYVVVGYLAGLAADDTDRSTAAALRRGRPGCRRSARPVRRGGLPARRPAGVGRRARAGSERARSPTLCVLTPFVVPVVGLLVRRVDPDAARRRA